MEVRATHSEDGFGRQEVLAAVERFAKSERSPVQYREMAVAIRELAPRFDEQVAEEAERNLVILALKILEARYEESMDAQLEALATTVWPTALELDVKLDPRPGESAAAYAERLCQKPLALECKEVVPEYRSLVLGALVWKRLSERARGIVEVCKPCRESGGFTEAARTYERHALDMSKQVRQAGGRSKPGHWPKAGDNAAPWPDDTPLVTMQSSGEAMLNKEPILPGTWGKVLAKARKQGRVLGVHMKPGARVSDLRVLVGQAADAGFDQIALQVRTPDYPYEVAEYRIGTGKNRDSRLVRVRDVDTIQVLVQALDALETNDGLPPRI